MKFYYNYNYTTGQQHIMHSTVYCKQVNVAAASVHTCFTIIFLPLSSLQFALGLTVLAGICWTVFLGGFGNQINTGYVLCTQYL